MVMGNCSDAEKNRSVFMLFNTKSREIRYSLFHIPLNNNKKLGFVRSSLHNHEEKILFRILKFVELFLKARRSIMCPLVNRPILRLFLWLFGTRKIHQ
jgi:hypothetical protein